MFGFFAIFWLITIMVFGFGSILFLIPFTFFVIWVLASLADFFEPKRKKYEMNSNFYEK